MTASKFARGVARRSVPLTQDEGVEAVSVDVRGLSPADIALIMEADGGSGLATLYGELTTGAVKPEDVIEVGLRVLFELPDLMAHIIARASDVPEEWETVKDLATGVQMELLQAITELTFRSESVTKKLMEIVAKYAKERLPAQPLRSESKAGSGT